MSASVFGRAAEPLVIDVWSDVVCPFCYLGDNLLRTAVEQFPHGSSVEIRYHSFQLQPDAPVGQAVLADDFLASHHRMPKAQIEQSHAGIAARGAELGLDYRWDSALMVNTIDAHRMIHLAKTKGQEHAMVDRLFRAEFTEGLNVGDHTVLADLASELGLDRAEAEKVLATKAYEKEIRTDLNDAREIGISGVPFFVFDMKRAVSGAQPLELFRKALDVSWQDRANQPA